MDGSTGPIAGEVEFRVSLGWWYAERLERDLQLLNEDWEAEGEEPISMGDYIAMILESYAEFAPSMEDAWNWPPGHLELLNRDRARLGNPPLVVKPPRGGRARAKRP